MSNKRQPDEPSIRVRSFGVTVRGRQILPPRALGWHELLYATRGILTVHTGQGSWVVPPHRAVWIPADMDYQLEMSYAVELRILYFKTGSWNSKGLRGQGDCFVVNVSPLLRELIRKTVRVGALDTRKPEHRRLLGVIGDELNTLDSVALQLPSLRDARAIRFAGLLSQPENALRPVEALLAECGASRRTMERIYQDETGMSLGQWVRRHKLLSALRSLAAGEGVESVALRQGYNSASAFIAMFRRELGTTPGRYFVDDGD